MKEIFKWMAAHPDAKLEFSFAEDMGMGRHGCMAIEVRSRWDSRAKFLVDVDIWSLLRDADEQHQYILSCLNDAYRKCVDEMPACKDDCMFAAMFWENTKWKNCCTLSDDGESDCDLKNEECSFLKTLESR